MTFDDLYIGKLVVYSSYVHNVTAVSTHFVSLESVDGVSNMRFGPTNLVMVHLTDVEDYMDDKEIFEYRLSGRLPTSKFENGMLKE